MGSLGGVGWEEGGGDSQGERGRHQPAERSGTLEQT